MTANAFMDDKQRSKEVRMNEHLSKPLDEKTLLDMMEIYVGEKKFPRMLRLQISRKFLKGEAKPLKTDGFALPFMHLRTIPADS